MQAPAVPLKTRLFDVDVIGKHVGCGGEVLFMATETEGTRKCALCEATGPMVILATDTDAERVVLEAIMIEETGPVDTAALARRSMSLDVELTILQGCE